MKPAAQAVVVLGFTAAILWLLSAGHPVWAVFFAFMLVLAAIG